MIITEFILSNPKTAVILLSVGISLVMTLVTKFFTDQIKMKELKDRQKDLQKKSKEVKGNLKEMEKLNQEILSVSMEMMKHSFKPLIITLLPLLVIFWWAKKTFAATALGGSWIWWYIGTSLISSILFKKILKVH
jgi:uncharacterized membrane protein (DUF106 family)